MRTRSGRYSIRQRGIRQEGSFNSSYLYVPAQN